MLLRSKLEFKFLLFIILAINNCLGFLIQPVGLGQTLLPHNLGKSRILKEANSNDKIDFGLRQDSPPISYRDNFGKSQGLCLELLDLLKKYLIQRQLVKQGFRIETGHYISLKERFWYTQYPRQGNNEHSLAGECGSDSIRNNVPKGIQFSNPFYTSKTLLLIRKNQAYKFSFLNEPFNVFENQKPKVGVTTSSLTKERVKNFFNSEVDIVEINGDREKAVIKLENEEIDAYASDEILLEGMLVSFKNSEDFYIDYSHIIGRESYGLVLPGDDKEWINTVNDFLKSNKQNIIKLIDKYNLNQNSSNFINPLYWALLATIFIVILAIILKYKKYEIKIIERSKLLYLYHNQDADPRIIAISFNQLEENHPDAELKIVDINKQGQNRFLLRTKTAPEVDQSELSAEYFATYNKIKTLPEREIRLLLTEKDSRICSLENFVNQALQRPSYYSNVEQVGTMTNNPGGFSVGGSVGGNVNNVQGDNNRAIQGDNNQGVLGDNNQVTQQNQVGADTGESLTKEDVVKLLAQLETLIHGAELPADTKEEVIEDLSAAKKATDKEEPNKQRALERLGTVAETLEKTSKGVEASQKIWTTAKPIIVKVATWLGAAAGSHLLGL